MGPGGARWEGGENRTMLLGAPKGSEILGLVIGTSLGTVWMAHMANTGPVCSKRL